VPVVGRTYSDAVSASNTSSYSIVSGALPTGLTLNSSTGAVTGTCTSAATYSFTVRASGPGGSADAAFSGSPTGIWKVYNGSTWVRATAQVYNGSSWTTGTVWVYNGSTWVAGS
jgi:hypothetical protein